MDQNDNTRWIDDYLDGNLSGEELEKFETRLLSDLKFEKEIKAQKMVRDSIKRAELLDFFDQLKEDAGDQKSVKNLFQSFGVRLSIAASVILLIGASLFILNRKSIESSTKTEFIAQTFNIEVYFEDNLRSLDENIEVQIVETLGYNFHYNFSEKKLKLYINDIGVSENDFKIFYDSFEEDPFSIEFKGERYILEEREDGTPIPLMKKAN